jgi:protein TonB
MGVMYAFLHRTIHYPEQALTDKLQGKVFVQFTVGSDGHVRDVVIRRGVRKDLDDEALRGIRAMPDWVPGEKDGHAVATRFIVPVSFTLDRTESPAKE